MTAPWIQTASGVAFDLLDPRPNMIRFAADVAPALARTPRFGGHVSQGPYSVAQHCVIGAEVLLAETGRSDLAAHFLLHDAHEAYVGDMTRPVASALAAAIAASLPDAPAAEAAVTFALSAMKHRIDAAIWTAAGIGHPTQATADQVRHMDLRMLETERRQLLPQCERHWDAGPVTPVRLKGALRPWIWTVAAERWLSMFRTLCPRGAI